MRMIDWSSDVCSSDLYVQRVREGAAQIDEVVDGLIDQEGEEYAGAGVSVDNDENEDGPAGGMSSKQLEYLRTKALKKFEIINEWFSKMRKAFERSEEHTSELQSLMRISYAVFCLKQKKNKRKVTQTHIRRQQQ